MATGRREMVQRLWLGVVLAVGLSWAPLEGGADPGCVERPASRSDRALAAVDLRLKLNVPAYRLDVYRNGTRIRRYQVAVGEPAYPTPLGPFLVMRVEWRPTWVPPRSDWVTVDTTVPPGASNPMGRVKLYFADLYFIHGSPETASLGRPKSHGCVRLSNPDAVELAGLVHRYGTPGLDSNAIAALARDTGATRVVWLEHPVPLTITYELAEVEDDRLTIYPDIYASEPAGALGPALTALSQAGYDLAEIDTAAVKDLAGRAGTEPASTPVATLVTGHQSSVIRHRSPYRRLTTSDR